MAQDYDNWSSSFALFDDLRVFISFRGQTQTFRVVRDEQLLVSGNAKAGRIREIKTAGNAVLRESVDWYRGLIEALIWQARLEIDATLEEEEEEAARA